jgi:hypothetical protein
LNGASRSSFSKLTFRGGIIGARSCQERTPAAPLTQSRVQKTQRTLSRAQERRPKLTAGPCPLLRRRRAGTKYLGVWPRSKARSRLSAAEFAPLAGIAGHARGGSPRSFCSFIESAALDQTPDTRRRRCQRQGAYRHQPNEPEPPLMSAARYFKISDDGQFLFIHRMLLSNQAPY